jgi:hypothetical protein
MPFVILLCCRVAVIALCGAFLTVQPISAQIVPPTGKVVLDPAVIRLAEAMHLPEVFDIMAEEGRDYGVTLEEEMFPSLGGAAWAADVDRIYAPERTYRAFLRALSLRLSGNAALPEMEAMLTSDLGRKANMLETTARRALLNKEVEEAARMRFEELAGQDDPRYHLVASYIDANDLVEFNVAGGMNAAKAFYDGLSAGGAFDVPMSEDQIVQEVWAQEPAIRAEAETWLGTMLTMAYAPLTDAELRQYTALSQAHAIRALNSALYSAFDDSFRAVSRDLGLAAAKYIAGEAL